MRLSYYVIAAVAFALAGAASLVTANLSVTVIEENSEIEVRRVLDETELGWAEVQADGLTVTLSGTAPSEAQRFQAISTTGTVIDAARVIDAMEVKATGGLKPPRFSVEILRNDSGISVIGLIPAETDREAVIDALGDMVGADRVADLLEVADYPVPDGWDDAIAFGLLSLSELPRSKVSVAAGFVEVKAITDSAEEKRELEEDLEDAAPPGLRLRLNIAAPRPVITPFTLRFIKDERGARFDACSADDEAAGARILDAARGAGAPETVRCEIGMGVPSPRWSEAAAQSIAAVNALGGGAVTLSDADITLVALQGADQSLFDHVVGELEAELPDVFALHAVLPEPETATEQGPPEFTATLSPEGLVQLRGRLGDENTRAVADSFAKARFGSARVYTAARLADGLPADWPVRVLAGLEALSLLENGVLTVTPDDVALTGITERETARAEIARLLADKLGETETYSIDITYREPPPPTDIPPTPEECEARLMSVQADGKIIFEPGSATISADALDTMNAIADILKECGDIRLEIQGHTDSQGREVMNQQLSQARAQSVLNELRARRILTSNFVAKGYGEDRPIASNETEDGREENRRIEFRLIRPEPSLPTPESTLDSVAEDVTEGNTLEIETDDEAEETVNEQN
jgi:OOP family OmpA-OmpF porin